MNEKNKQRNKTVMEGWKEYKFEELADFPPKVKLVKGEKYPFVLMDEIDAGFKYVRASFSKNYNGSGAKFENGDTLFARITPSLENGKIAQIKGIDKPAFGSTEFFVFRGRKGISDNDFIYYLSKTDWFRQNAVNSMVGASGRQRADAKFVAKTKLLIPSLPTQHRIAKILSAYDDLIENNLKRIKLLEEMAQKTYEEWFVRFKFPGHETAKFNKETGLPEGWKRVKLGEVANFKYGKALKSTDRNAGKYPVYGSAGIVGWHNDYICKAPGIIVGRKGNVGSVFWSELNYYPIDTVYYISSKLPLNYIYYLIKYIPFINNDAAVPGLNRNAAYLMKCILPSEILINKFTKIIKPIFKQIQTLKNQNQRLKEARDILLPRLMTGVINV